MVFISEKNVIHRDLGLRNVLISGSVVNDWKIKIADFGLSIVSKTPTVDLDTVLALPVKYAAPESLFEGIFSSKSDVWGFGVVIWETFSFGKIPFPILSNEEYLVELKKGIKLEAGSSKFLNFFRADTK